MTAAEAGRWAGAPVTVSPLEGVELRVGAVATPGRPLWWAVTRGLFAQSGLELSLRLPRGKDELTPPPFLAPVMTKLIGFAREGRLTEGQVVEWPRPFGPGVETDLGVFALTIDPAFGTIRTAHDAVPVLLAVGLTADEARLVREWSPQGLLEVLARLDPTLSTSVERASLLSSPRARQAIEQRVEREGSSMGVLVAERSELSGKDKATWTLDTRSCDALVSLLKGRLGHQRPFTVRSATSSVEVVPADSDAFTASGNQATLKLTQPTSRALRANLKPLPGRYRWDDLPNLTIEVKPGTELRPPPSTPAVNVPS
ncbi:MAG: suppressor of fused domain protein [Myxococcaceae bacterium]|nr:suppressor of fused domain protein [Myxococcaceae bacterium]